ncbi:hypothetical protein J4217_01285 [Candidatus Pacearchaeota archaeon]|nr:hypothetical protein [Candidatus Pacearchaeota archaeon]
MTGKLQGRLQERYVKHSLEFIDVERTRILTYDRKKMLVDFNIGNKKGSVRIEVRNNERNRQLYQKGERYLGVFEWDMKPDFLGDDPKKMDIGTCCLELRRVYGFSNKPIYERE